MSIYSLLASLVISSIVTFLCACLMRSLPKSKQGVGTCPTHEGISRTSTEALA